jgi:hypothetical protein
MERKKRSHLQQFGKFYFKKPKNPLTKRKRSAKRTKSPVKRMKSTVKRTKSPAKHEKTKMRSRCPVCIYARNRPKFANLPKMPNPDTKLLDKYFSHFNTLGDAEVTEEISNLTPRRVPDGNTRRSRCAPRRPLLIRVAGHDRNGGRVQMPNSTRRIGTVRYSVLVGTL